MLFIFQKNTIPIRKLSIPKGTPKEVIQVCLDLTLTFYFTIIHRWNPENKANMDPYAFMPFGMGPRNCIANRFAQEEIKLVLCALVKQFRFFPVEETPVWISLMEYNRFLFQ